MDAAAPESYVRGSLEWLLLVAILLVGAVGVTVINRWEDISSVEVLALGGAAAAYLGHTVAGEWYLGRFESPIHRASYFVIQFVLGAGMLYLIARLGVMGSGVFVFVPVLAQSVSKLRWPAGPVAVAAAGLVVFLGVLHMVIGTANLAEAAVGYTLMAGFVVAMMRAVMREREARYQAQALAAQLQAYIERSTQTTVGAVLSEPLTARETQVLRCVCRGMSNKAIADALFLAEGTVKNHMTSVLGKLEVRDRTQAALKARDMGLA